MTNQQKRQFCLFVKPGQCGHHPLHEIEWFLFWPVQLSAWRWCIFTNKTSVSNPSVGYCIYGLPQPYSGVPCFSSSLQSSWLRESVWSCSLCVCNCKRSWSLEPSKNALQRLLPRCIAQSFSTSSKASDVQGVTIPIPFTVLLHKLIKSFLCWCRVRCQRIKQCPINVFWVT